MGNHEYCEDCGESDFHLDRPCDPVKVAAKLAAKEEHIRRMNLAIAAMEKALMAANIPYRVNQYGNAEVFWCDFME